MLRVNTGSPRRTRRWSSAPWWSWAPWSCRRVVRRHARPRRRCRLLGHAELGHAVPGDLARRGVGHEGVEELAVVGHLQRAVGLLGRRQGPRHARGQGGRGPGGHGDGGPRLEARSGAHVGRPAVVGTVGVEGHAGAVDEDGPELAAAGGLHRGGRGRGGGGRADAGAGVASPAPWWRVLGLDDPQAARARATTARAATAAPGRTRPSRRDVASAARRLGVVSASAGWVIAVLP